MGISEAVIVIIVLIVVVGGSLMYCAYRNVSTCYRGPGHSDQMGVFFCLFSLNVCNRSFNPQAWAGPNFINTKDNLVGCLEAWEDIFEFH